MAHLIIQSAILQILKQNMALYDFLCDVINDVADEETRAWLQGTRYDFMAEALRYISDTDDLTAVIVSDTRVHKCRLLREIDRNRKLRKHVNDTNQYWDAEGKRGAVVPVYARSDICKTSPTADTQHLPETVSVTQLCNHLLHTYYYKNDVEVSRALPIMASNEKPGSTYQRPINEHIRESPNVHPCSHISTLTAGGDTVVFDLSAPTFTTRSPEATPTRVPCTFMEVTEQATRRYQAGTEMEGKRRRMSQWLNDQAVVNNSHCCHQKSKPSMLGKTIALARRTRAMTTVPSLGSRPSKNTFNTKQHKKPRTILKLSKHMDSWAVKTCGDIDGQNRQC